MADTEESPAQRQARLRREKREKKILEGGSSRLDRITNVSGRTAAETTDSSAAEPQATSTSTASPTFQPSSRSHSAALRNQSARDDPTHDELEASMQEFLHSQPLDQDQQPLLFPVSYPSRAARPPQSFGGATDQNMRQEPQDPMLAMLQQLMGGAMPPMLDNGGNPANPMAGGGAGANGFEGLPPALAAMLGGNGPGGGPGAAETPIEAARNVYIWKILHAMFSLILGSYILYTYTFSGTLVSRLRVPGLNGSTFESSVPVEGRLFWIFITAELGLQGGRYLLEGGRSTEEGMIKMVSGFLPYPWGDRVRLVGRYASIWSTLVQDAFVVVFLLGVAAWWRGTSESSTVV